MNHNSVLALILLLLLSSVCFGQAKQDMITKKWSYKGVEEFGVIKSPDSTMKNDWIQLNADGTYSLTKNGKNSNGKWSLNEQASLVSLTDSKSNKKTNYNLKKLDEKEMIIEFQTPDLVRTRYIYQVSAQ